jgi:hypothetical protein
VFYDWGGTPSGSHWRKVPLGRRATSAPTRIDANRTVATASRSEPPSISLSGRHIIHNNSAGDKSAIDRELPSHAARPRCSDHRKNAGNRVHGPPRHSLPWLNEARRRAIETGEMLERLERLERLSRDRSYSSSGIFQQFTRIRSRASSQREMLSARRSSKGEPIARLHRGRIRGAYSGIYGHPSTLRILACLPRPMCLRKLGGARGLAVGS